MEQKQNPGGGKPLRPCGTAAAYRRHISRGEEPCGACREAKREDSRTSYKRRNQAGWEPRKLQPCGTYAGFRRHYRRGEEPCAPCREAKKEAQRLPYWVVYVRKFEDGMWYYGSGRKRLDYRKNESGGKIGEYRRKGIPHTIEGLMRCDSRDLALQMEARFILASDRDKLLNKHLPWHFCWETNPGVGAYKWHRRRGEPACEPSKKAMAEYKAKRQQKTRG